jgi:hypothetical protein
VCGVSIPLGHWRSGGLSSIGGCHSFCQAVEELRLELMSLVCRDGLFSTIMGYPTRELSPVMPGRGKTSASGCSSPLL